MNPQIPVTTEGRKIFINLLTKKIKNNDYDKSDGQWEKQKKKDVKLLEEAINVRSRISTM